MPQAVVPTGSGLAAVSGVVPALLTAISRLLTCVGVVVTSAHRHSVVRGHKPFRTASLAHFNDRLLGIAVE